MLIYADVTNKDFLQSFEDLKPLLAMTGGQMQLNSTGKDQYEFRMYRQSIWFGVKDNLLYISNNEDWQMRQAAVTEFLCRILLGPDR